MTTHALSLSMLASDTMGIEGAMSPRDNVLIPLSGQLGELRGDQEPADHLSTAMGVKVLRILYKDARRSHIDEDTLQAYGFLTPRSAELSGIAPHCQGYRGPSEQEHLSVMMGAMLLTAARVLTGLPGADDDFAQDGSALRLNLGAQRFVLPFDGWLSAGHNRRLSEQERFNTRIVLDIAKPYLQSRPPAT
ncbi:hypothetical protein [Salipiger sp.]|uniref:hypothetical protein n=1 Tax=Salipiger sp. TaxID=2078585 RepID=UPI003A9730DE